MKTKATVIDYQKSTGIQADGVVGQQTWSILNDFYWHDTPYEDRVVFFFNEVTEGCAG